MSGLGAVRATDRPCKREEEEGRWKRAEGRGKRGEGRGKRGEGRGEREEGRGKRGEGRGERRERKVSSGTAHKNERCILTYIVYLHIIYV